MRVEIPIVVINPTNGEPISNAQVYILNRVTNAQAIVYNNESDSSTKTQPLTTDSSGRVQGWVLRGPLLAQITATGFSMYEEPFEAVPAKDRSIDRLWLAEDVLPVGIIMPYGGVVTASPSGWVICDGRQLTTGGVGQQYERLYAVIGTTFGGTGPTSFNVPDLRGRVPMGADGIGGTYAGRVTANRDLGNNGGSQTHRHTVDSHRHGYRIRWGEYFARAAHVMMSAYRHSDGVYPGAALNLGSTAGTAPGNTNTAYSGGIQQYGSDGDTTAVSPLTDYINNLSPYLGVHYIMKAE